VLFRVLVRLRRLRGTALDPFGRAEVRRVERALGDEQREVVRRALEALAPRTHEEVARIAGLADAVRGYEDVKLRAVAAWRRDAEDALAALASPPASLPVVQVGGPA
jgi:indolepyruvate ferredoxin oxidoreductase